MDQEALRKQRLQAGHALADLLRGQAVALEKHGEADALWGLLMRWTEAAAEESVALGVEDAPSATRVLEQGEALADAVRSYSASAHAEALREWEQSTYE